MKLKLAYGSNSSLVVEACQVCGSSSLESLFFAGFLPPVNTLQPIGTAPREQPSFPAQVLLCAECRLAQIGLIVDPKILFPPHYAYTSGTTKILRENFAEMYREVMKIYPLAKDDLVVDIGSNDGTLLGNFKNHRAFGIEPTQAGNLARAKGIDTLAAFFGKDAVREARKRGQAKLVTITNCFAHMEDIHSVVDGVLEMLRDDGIFLTESHYLVSLIETVQYDTIYHEHLRYYSVTSLKYLLAKHDLEVIRVKRIPTHGGSIRVYAARKGRYAVDGSVKDALLAEETSLSETKFSEFARRVVMSKLGLHAMLKEIKAEKHRVVAIGAPSRAATLMNYVGLDAGIIDCVLEISGSYKINKYMPGTLIPIYEESRLFEDQPEYALLLSWHIADELVPKLQARGYKGQFIVPLPVPHIIQKAVEKPARSIKHVEETV